MRRLGFATALLSLLLPACGAWQNPRPGPIRAMEPRPNPPLRAAAAPVTQQPPPWLPRFWEELSPAQRRQVEARLRRGRAARRMTAEEVGAAWDVMGLPQRQALITGRAAPPVTRAAAGEVASPLP